MRAFLNTSLQRLFSETWLDKMASGMVGHIYGVPMFCDMKL